MEWFALALLGGMIGLDATSFPQAMLSRPLVAASLTGMILGQPLAGIAVGAVLETFALVVLPVGAARYPETGTAAVSAAAAFSMLAPASAGGLLLALAFGMYWERVAGASVILARRWNESMVASRTHMSAERLERLHLTAISIDFLRGAGIATAGALLGGFLLRLIAPFWGMGTSTTLALIGVCAAAMLGAVLPLFGGWKERWIGFVVGIACGILLLLVQA